MWNDQGLGFHCINIVPHFHQTGGYWFRIVILFVSLSCFGSCTIISLKIMWFQPIFLFICCEWSLRLNFSKDIRFQLNCLDMCCKITQTESKSQQSANSCISANTYETHSAHTIYEDKSPVSWLTLARICVILHLKKLSKLSVNSFLFLYAPFYSTFFDILYMIMLLYSGVTFQTLGHTNRLDTGQGLLHAVVKRLMKFFYIFNLYLEMRGIISRNTARHCQ